MSQYNSLNIKFSNSQLNELKPDSYIYIYIYIKKWCRSSFKSFSKCDW